jgi:hypothetical protein
MNFEDLTEKFMVICGCILIGCITLGALIGVVALGLVLYTEFFGAIAK